MVIWNTLAPTMVLGAAGLVMLLAFGAFAVVSFAEGERRATRVSLAVALSASACLFAATALPPMLQLMAVGVLLCAGLALAVAFLLPIGRVDRGNDVPGGRFDERDIMFARARLEPGRPEYDDYYARRPDHQAGDDATRAKPGLLSPDAQLADPLQFASPAGSFGLTHALRHGVDGPVAEARHALDPGAATRYVKDLAGYYGALETGVAALQPYHVYSHVGRGTGGYGTPISVDHGYAVAFTVEMDFDMVGAAPAGPTVMESGRQYVESARVAVQLAGAIRALGYPARAHIDGNYRVIAPLVARDAGLGEFGRMGLLMTPRLGPRVRLGVVTTDLPLAADEHRPDTSVLDFCTICRKCAECCPSRSIPMGERELIDGALRWRIDSATCFRYWNVIGTDCARCMAVCPYSHPGTFSHNILRWGIRRSGGFRRAALALDDLFYGKHPPSRDAPAWTEMASSRRVEG